VATGINLEVADLHAILVIFAEQDAAGYIFKCGSAIFIFIYELFNVAPAMWFILGNVVFALAHSAIIAAIRNWCLIGL
jgi:hypothetical protein